MTSIALSRVSVTGLLRLAVAAARAGAAEIIRRAECPVTVGRKSSRTDEVSDADLAAGQAISRMLSRERPRDGRISEEGDSAPARSGLRWVIDPLDGTTNHLYRIPHLAVSVACERVREDGWQPLVGVVIDAARGETFTAARGAGACRDGTAISVNNDVDLPDALVATEFSYRASSHARQVTALGKVLPRVRGIRSTGSSALDLCWTAAGRFDGFYEDELSHWDWAAGALIVQEAGGLVSALGTGVVAGPASVHAPLRALVAGDSDTAAM